VHVLFTVFDTIADSMEDNFDAMLADMFGLFGTTINDPESYPVRVTTMQ
jgi:hypothetical protein